MASIWDLPSVPTAPQASWNGGQQNPANMFYQGGNYGQTQDWYNSPISQNIRQDNLDLAYASYGNRAGVADDNSSFSRWFQQQMPRFQRAYGQATMDNPTMTIDQFLSTLPQYQQLRNEFNAQSPLATGRATGYASASPPARWIPR